jgi:hypothetical protein
MVMGDAKKTTDDATNKTSLISPPNVSVIALVVEMRITLATLRANAAQPLTNRTLEKGPAIRSYGKSSASKTKKPREINTKEGGAM